MRKINYNDKPIPTGTSTHRGVDEQMEETVKFEGTSDVTDNSYREGFAASSGVRNGTAETGGRVRHPETGDDSRPDRTPDSIENENAGLADN